MTDLEPQTGVEVQRRWETYLHLRPQHSDRDFTEDFIHENGLYECACSRCRSKFYGHKRRIACKVCERRNKEEDSDERVE